jgi:plasmid stability protein
MSTKSPRIHTVLEPPLYEAVELLAKKHGLSLSQEVRDLVREALELTEDRALADLAAARRQSFDRTKALTVAQARKRLKASRKGK